MENFWKRWKWAMEEPREAQCRLCGKWSFLVADFLGLCRECIVADFPRALPLIEEAHRRAREVFHLSYPAPSGAPLCRLCVHECGGGEKSFCGLLERGERFAGTSSRGLLEWYYDDLPTNCVASFVCPERKHFGYKNLAVFYAGCSFNCLFCQNWHFHDLVEKHKPLVSVAELLEALHPRVACVCFFGGDPTPQVAHAISFSQKARGKIRICWETNGAANPEILQKMYELSCESGGIVKIDLKAFDERVHLALTGVSSRRTLENFARLAEKSKKYEEVTLVASTPLVPGYVTEEEVGQIAQFIARGNPNIPYSLLGFAPNFFFDNLPSTSVRHAEEALRLSKEAGLRRVEIGNRFLLSRWY